MSVQTELTRISTAKTNIKNVVNNNTANAITNQKLDAFPPLINGTIATQKSYIPWIKDEGKHLTLKNSKSGELDRFEMYGNTEQTTYTGKNLLNNVATTQTLNGITFTKREDGSMLVNGTSTNLTALNLIDNNIFTLSAGQYKISGCPTGGGTDTYRIDINNGEIPAQRDVGSGSIFTRTANLTVSNVRIRIASGVTINNLVFNPMIRLASITDDTYEPYCGGVAAPNPDYPQEVKVVKGDNTIKVTGKNLLNTNLMIEFTPNNANWWSLDGKGQFYNATNIAKSNLYYDLKANTTYTFSVYQHKNISTSVTSPIQLVNPNGNVVVSIKLIDEGLKKSFTTTNAIRVYPRIATNEANVLTQCIVQLEEGSTATTYEPYQNQDYEINLHGKNLFNKDSVILGKVWNGASNTKRAYGYIKAIQGQVYTASTQDTSSDLNIYITETAVVGTGDNHIKQTELTSTLTFTPQSATKYIVVQFTTTTNDITQEMVNNALIQIEKGSTATIYEPYYDYELCKVRDYKDEIKKSTGKNLFDKDNETIQNGYLNYDGSYTSANNWTGIYSYLKIKPNTTYTFSCKKIGTRFIWCEYTSKNVSNIIGVRHESSTTFTTSSTANYVRICTNSSVINDIMLEENSISTEYEPYGKVWYIKKNIDKIVLDDSESWFTQRSTSPYVFALNYDNYKRTQENICKCNFFLSVVNGGYGDLTDGQIRFRYNSGDTNKNLYVCTTVASTINDFKTWLSTHNTEVYYVLATPTYEKITNETLINQLNTIETFEGINNISIENENNVLPDLLMITKNKDSYNNWKTKEGLN